MNIPELFIRRPVMTTLVMLGILLFGILGYRLLPVSDLPTVDFPTILATVDFRERALKQWPLLWRSLLSGSFQRSPGSIP